MSQDEHPSRNDPVARLNSVQARINDATAAIARAPLSKVPEITLYFWIIKVLCTTVGETAADFLNEDLGLGLTGTSVIMAALLGVVLYFQFRAPRYIAGIYWLAVVLISIVGTLITDNLVDNWGVPSRSPLWSSALLYS